ncbi:MAG TPA: AAA family ATPase [Thermoleophilaceae bacterium]|jgi:DNA-binding CsgD family transcriptional regulator|nr:AAA family ATPase [Thermoleophilaceae bacterium]
MTDTWGPGLVGRATERNTLDGLLGKVRTGESEALVIRGEAGIGKTALLRYAARQASGFRVTPITGVEAEVELAFAGVHQLYSMAPERLDGLPVPQRNALSVALGLVAGEAPDRFLVGLAVLSLLSAVAAERPLLCLIDDAQWLDAASAQILGFVARRVRAESVAIIVAVRAPGGEHEFDGLPEIHLEGLPQADALPLLASVVAGRLDDGVADRIVAETRGNPLALLELPSRMTAAELAGGFDLPVGSELPTHIEDHYMRRVRELPETTQELMLLAATEPLGDPGLVLRAGRQLDIAGDALAPATAAGLLEIGTRVQFHHPLVRSAIYRAAPLRSRRRAHEVLAEVSHRDEDADRRAWHRALAAAGPDENVAAELEHSASRARARGGVAATAAFLQRAAALTPDPARRAGRALAAADASVQSGEFATARALLATAEAGPVDDLQRGRIDLSRARLAFVSSRGAEAIPLLLAAARALEPLDVSVARETYVDAFSATIFGGRLSGAVDVRAVARAARRAPRPTSDEPSTADRLLDALVALADEYATAVPLYREIVKRVSDEEASEADRLRWQWLACLFAYEMWDDEHAFSLSRSGVELAREAGTLSQLALALGARGPILVFCGDLAGAAATSSEMASVEEATGIRAAPYGALLLSAWRGRADEAKRVIDTTEREARARDDGSGLATCAYARAILFNGLARYDEALGAADFAREHQEFIHENCGLSELVEAATRCGRVDLATEALDRLAIKAQATESSWARGIEARARALLAEDGADHWFHTAIDHLGRTRIRAELARTRLLYGEWLRREGRRLDARAELNTAYQLFASMGMEAFAQRAAVELVATGERRRRGIAETRDDLTPQERQIAELARDGLSNPEIGSRLFLSPRTIEWHLRHVYSKLKIRSRRELAVALRASEAPPDS